MPDSMLSSGDHSPLLHWHWNSALREDLLLRQLRAMAEAGFGGAVIEIAMTASPAFLSEGWLSLLHACAVEAASLKLRLWLGGTIFTETTGSPPPAAEDPSARACYARYHVEDVRRDVLEQWVFPVAEDFTTLSAIAAPLSDNDRTPDFSSAADFLSSLPDPSAVLGAFDTDVRVWVWTRHDLAGPDPLHPETAQRWIHQAGSRLQEVLGAHFGGVLAGFQARPPSLWPGAACADDRCFPWSRTLPEAFLSLHGYALEPRLPALVAGMGEDAARVRQDFWATIIHCREQNLSHPLRHWARERNMDWAWVLPDAAGSLQTMVQHHADAVALFGDARLAVFETRVTELERQVPLNNAVLSGGTQADTFLAARLAASVAALRGEGAGALADCREALSGATHQTRLPALHRLMHCGVHRFALRAEYSVVPEESAHSELHQPYFAFERDFTAYLARCSYALGRGRPGARLGVVVPSRSIQAHYHPAGHRFTRWVGEDFHGVLRLLDELHFDYLLLPEDELCRASCEGGKLFCGAARLPLEMVVLASATTLSRAAWDKIEEFVACGGKAACLGLLPRWSERGRDAEQEARIGKTTLLTVADGYEMASHSEGGNAENGAPSPEERVSDAIYPVYHEHRSGGRLCCYQPLRNHDRDDARRRVHQILRESLTPDFETQAPGVLYTRRVLDGGELYFVVNDLDMAQRVTLRLRPQDAGAVFQPYLLDAWTGKNRPLPVWMTLHEDDSEKEASVTGGLSFSLELAAHEAGLIWLRRIAASAPASTPDTVPTPDEAPGRHLPRHAERANFTVESINGTLACGYATESGVPRVAARSGARLRWHQGNEVKIPAPLLLLDEWIAQRHSHNALPLTNWQLAPLPTGFRIRWTKTRAVVMSTRVRLQEAVPSLYLVLSNPALLPPGALEVSLNGTVIPTLAAPPIGHAPWSDPDRLWFDLSAAREGDNEVQCGGSDGLASLLRHESRPPLLVGEWEIAGNLAWGEGDTLTVPQPLIVSGGPWHEQGLPCYAGVLEYSQQVNIPADWSGCRVFLELAKARDVATLMIDDTFCGTRLAVPYRWDITHTITPGKHCVVRLRVANTSEPLQTAANFERLPAGLLGPARMVAYPTVEIDMGSGETP